MKKKLLFWTFACLCAGLLAWNLFPHEHGFSVPREQIRPVSGYSHAFYFPRTPFFRDAFPSPFSRRVFLYEDEKLLGPPRAGHGEIQDLGGGRYSLWDATLYFSSSDQTDPAKNKKSYRGIIKTSPAAWLVLAALAFLAVPFLFYANLRLCAKPGGENIAFVLCVFAASGLIALAALGPFLQILSGRMIMNSGSAAGRVLISYYNTAHGFPHLFSSHVWGPLPFMVQECLVRSCLWAGVSNISGQVKVLLVFSQLLWALAILVLSRALSFGSGKWTFLVAAAFLAGLPCPYRLSYSGMPENYAFFLISLGIYFFWLHLDYGKKTLVLSSIFFLMANMARRETLLLSLSTFVFLLFIKEYRKSIIFLVVSTSYMSIKSLIALLIKISAYTKSSNFLSIHKDSFSNADINVIMKKSSILFHIFLLDNYFYFILMCLSVCILIFFRRYLFQARFAYPPKDKLLYYVFLILPLACFLLLGHFSGYIDIKDRNTVFLLIFTASIFALFGGNILDRLMARPPGKFQHLLLAPLLLIFLNSAGSIAWQQAKTKYPGTDFLAMARKINQTLLPGEVIGFDHLKWREVPLALHTMGPFPGRPFFSPFLYLDSPFVSFSDARNPEYVTRLMHASLDRKRPVYLVALSEAARKGLRITPMDPSGLRTSYFLPFLKPCPAEGSYCFVSPYLDPERQVVFQLVYENRTYHLYRVSYPGGEGLRLRPPEVGKMLGEHFLKKMGSFF